VQETLPRRAQAQVKAPMAAAVLGVARFLVNGRKRAVQQAPRSLMSVADGSPPGSHDRHVGVEFARLLGARCL
jgi:hypothetical protein